MNNWTNIVNQNEGQVIERLHRFNHFLRNRRTEVLDRIGGRHNFEMFELAETRECLRHPLLH